MMTETSLETSPNMQNNAQSDREFILSLAHYEGPLDLLLAQAREQKVDLAEISVLQLVEQYLDFINRAQNLQLELAADYLGMAAWLVYLKSRLLIPQEEENEDEPSGAELAAALQYHLQRLAAVRMVSQKLWQNRHQGMRRFGRVETDRDMEQILQGVQPADANLYDILQAWAGLHRRKRQKMPLKIAAPHYESVKSALQRIERLLQGKTGWIDFYSLSENFDQREEDRKQAEPKSGPKSGLEAGSEPELEEEPVTPTASPFLPRSQIAASFAACLQLAKEERIILQQTRPLGPLYLRNQALAPSHADGHQQE